MKDYRIRLPRLCDRTTLAEIARLHPLKLNATEKERPMGTGKMELPPTDPIPEYGQFVELFSASRSIGYWRVAGVSTTRRKGKSISVTLNHAISTMDNDVVFGEITYDKGQATAWQVFLQLMDRQAVRYWAPRTTDAEAVAYLQSVSPEFEFQDESLLDALLHLIGFIDEDMYLDCDFSTFPWTVIPVKAKKDPLCEARLSRNISSCDIGYDWSNLCTRIYPISTDSDGNRITIEPMSGGQSLDSANISKYGIVSKVWSAKEDVQTVGDLVTAAWAQLGKVENPAVSASIDGFDFSGLTGVDADDFRVGYPCRIVIPEDGIAVTERILTITHNDLVTDPARVTLEIGKQEKLTASRKAKQEESSGGGGGGGGASTKSFTQEGSATLTITYNAGHWSSARRTIVVNNSFISISSAVFTLTPDDASVTFYYSIRGTSYSGKGQRQHRLTVSPGEEILVIIESTENTKSRLSVTVAWKIVGRVKT